MTSKVLKGEDYTCDTCKNEAHTATPGAPIPRNYWIAVSETRWSKAYFTTITEDYHFCSDACYAAWKANGKEPRSEQSLAEAARALGQKAGNDYHWAVLELLKAAEETTSEDHETTLGGIIIAIARRLRRGDWR